MLRPLPAFPLTLPLAWASEDATGDELGLGFPWTKGVSFIYFSALPCIVEFFPGVSAWDWLPGTLLFPRADSPTWCQDPEARSLEWSPAIQGGTWRVEKQSWGAGSLASKGCKCVNSSSSLSQIFLEVVAGGGTGPSREQQASFPPLQTADLRDSACLECPVSYPRTSFWG